jgi:hypothetical protein
MLECEGCHRFVHVTESSCPFCATPVVVTSEAQTSAVGLARMPTVALAAGLSLLACDKSDDEVGEGSETSSTAGDGDGDYSGSDYGGPPPCDELASAIPISIGANPINTTMTVDSFSTSCGDQTGTGPDQLLQFTAPTPAGVFAFELTGANFDGWLLEFNNYYCFADGGPQCTLNQGLEISLQDNETLYLIIDGTGGGTASVDVTQN